MSVVTISRQFGAGGRTLGLRIAKELGYRFLDDMVIQELAKRANVTADSIKDMERTSGSWLSKLISGILSSGYMERIIGAGKGYIDEEIYIELLQEVIIEFAKQDNVVLIGRGGQYILSDFEGAIHILLVSDMKHRIEFMQRFYDLSDSRAEKAIHDGNARRSNLFEKLHHTNYNDPILYHMVLNMSKLSIEQALKMVLALVEVQSSQSEDKSSN